VAVLDLSTSPAAGPAGSSTRRSAGPRAGVADARLLSAGKRGRLGRPVPGSGAIKGRLAWAAAACPIDLRSCSRRRRRRRQIAIRSLFTLLRAFFPCSTLITFENRLYGVTLTPAYRHSVCPLWRTKYTSKRGSAILTDNNNDDSTNYTAHRHSVSVMVYDVVSPFRPVESV